MEDIHEIIKKKYSEAITSKSGGCCCGGSSTNPGGCCGSDTHSNAANRITGNLYASNEIEGLDPDLIATSFGCGNPTALAGALLDQEYQDKLAAAGFENIEVEITREYDLTDDQMQTLLPSLSEAEKDQLNGSIVSAFVRAKKPA